jgi:hypothetical protein
MEDRAGKRGARDGLDIAGVCATRPQRRVAAVIHRLIGMKRLTGVEAAGKLQPSIETG